MSRRSSHSLPHLDRRLRMGASVDLLLRKSARDADCLQLSQKIAGFTVTSSTNLVLRLQCCTTPVLHETHVARIPGFRIHGLYTPGICAFRMPDQGETSMSSRLMTGPPVNGVQFEMAWPSVRTNLARWLLHITSFSIQFHWRWSHVLTPHGSGLR